MLKAGMARADITPPLGLELAGYPHYPRNNTGHHDPLYATCMYLCDGENEIAMVTLDLLFFSKKYVGFVREKVFAEIGMKSESIMIGCSHTHSGPWASGYDDVELIESGKEIDAAYVNDIVKKIADCIIEAKKTSFEASFAYGTGICGAESGVGGNRRMPGGPHDPIVSVMAVRDSEAKLRGAIVNYTLHPTFIHEWSTVCTADFPLYVRLEVEENYAGALACFSQGASGNQSSRYYRQGESYDEAERVGRKIGACACEILTRCEWRSDISLSTSMDSLDVELRKFDSQDVLRKRAAEARSEYETLYEKFGKSENRNDYYLWQNANLRYLGAEGELVFSRIMSENIPAPFIYDETPAEILVFRIGDLCVIGLPGEIFVEYALYLKAMAGFSTVIVNELTGGSLPGYLYTPQAFVDGGYEVGTSLLSPSFGIKLVNKTLEVINKVK